MKIAIVGGGIAGLSAAYYALKRFGQDTSVTIFEKSDDIGGLAGTIPIANTHIEKYYHHIFTHDNYYLDLAEELGLTDQIVWSSSKVGYYHNGISYPFTTPFDLLRFKPLSFLSRIRLGVSSLFISKFRNVAEMEQMTTEQFMLKHVGKQGWEVVWKPMLRIKFGENYNKIPAVWIWERIVQRMRTRSGGGNKELLGYMKGGFHVLNISLVERIKEMGCNVVLNADVSEIVIDHERCRGLYVNGEFDSFDKVICTAALPVYIKLIRNAPIEYIQPLNQVEYDCALVVLMELRNKLSDYYWLNISDNNIPFGGIIEHTNLIPSTEYEGKTLVYFSKYLNVDHELLRETNEEIIRQYVDAIKQIKPDFDEKEIISYTISRDRYAQPIWPMKYSEIKPEYKTPIDGLYLANTSQIYPNDRGMNFSVKLGKEVVDTM